MPQLQPPTSLAERFAALDELLEARTDAPSDDERATLKADIIALIRDVDREIAALAALREESKGLAAKWKQLPVAPVIVTAAPVPNAPPPVEPEADARDEMHEIITTRVDHLGASTYVAKGWSAISVADFPQAERALSRALELAPEDLEAAALYGWSLMGQDRLDEALNVLQGVLARQPSHELARVNVGWVCLRKGIFGEAIEHLVRAARGGTDRKASLYANHYLGLVYLRREMYDDAVSFFQRALALGPNLVEARYELGRALWFGGERDAAIEAWRAGASSGKFNAWAKRCDELVAAVEQGGAPPAVVDSAA